ncbi:hypothetical protein GEOBRER4_n0516 [Citrifermentans bremense]|uniref:DUF2513 domain-containing protein n=1 Tax=Citrifermentans bremense TaxID=60035 RepID=A0A6S6LY15_9BACT|nr:DUF2513 domain-containing protein [Citrifermentans bremense]BCG45750.1 hypothetical protein GEOBRER4_n0516 [Citrifermentans bremense]
MKIDQDYLKALLEAFQDSSGPLTDIEELATRGFPYETDEFTFHMEILLDKGFIESKSSKGGIGYILGGNGCRTWSVVPLRLTATGHEFIEALQQPGVMDQIKTNFKGAGLSVIKNVAVDLATGYAKQKVQTLLGC